MAAPNIPLQAQTLYVELLDAHASRPIREMDAVGAPFQRTINGKIYWYANVRAGSATRQHYLGADSEALRARLALISREREEARSFEQRCGTMAAQLRAARLPALDAETGKVLVGLAHNGVFERGGTLVGTHAFRLYDAELGRRVTQAALAQTEDVDIASFARLSLALADSLEADQKTSLTDTLKDLALETIPSLDPGGKSSCWRRRGGGAALDFLTPSFSDETDLVALEALGVWAQPLHFLNYLIAEPIQAVALYRSGILVRIPRPERFAIHKLIVAQRRSGPGLPKRRKDLAQANAIIEAMNEDRPVELRSAFEAAMAEGPAWRDLIQASLKTLPSAAAILQAL